MARKYEALDMGVRSLPAVTPEDFVRMMERYIKTGIPTMADPTLSDISERGLIAVWWGYGTYPALEPESFFADWYENTPPEDPYRKALDESLPGILRDVVERGMNKKLSEAERRTVRAPLTNLFSLGLLDESGVLKDPRARALIEPLLMPPYTGKTGYFLSTLLDHMNPLFGEQDRPFLRYLMDESELTLTGQIAATRAYMRAGGSDHGAVMDIVKLAWQGAMDEYIFSCDALILSEEAAEHYGIDAVWPEIEAMIPPKSQPWFQSVRRRHKNPDFVTAQSTAPAP